MLKQVLQSINFSDKEATVYLALQELGSSTATAISKKTGLNRTTIYDISDSLLNKGVVSSFKKRSTTYFHALDPQQLVRYVEREQQEAHRVADQKKQQIKELLPQFLSLQTMPSTRPKVQFFEGEKGMREAYEDSLTCRGTMYAYTNVATMIEALPHFFPDYFKRRAAAKIPIHAIFVDNPASHDRAKQNQAELRETRFLPNSDMTFSPEVKLYNNKMLIASWKERMAVIIESKEFVDLQKLVFQMLWNMLSKGGGHS